jgi:hypothetical protein
MSVSLSYYMILKKFSTFCNIKGHVKVLSTTQYTAFFDKRL